MKCTCEVKIPGSVDNMSSLWSFFIKEFEITASTMLQFIMGLCSTKSEVFSKTILSCKRWGHITSVCTGSVTHEALWPRRLLVEINSESSDEPTVIFEEYQPPIAMTKSPQFHEQTKHMSIKYHYIRVEMLKGSVNVIYCPTTDMVADVLTKGLWKEQLVTLHNKTGLVQCSGYWGGVLE